MAAKTIRVADLFCGAGGTSTGLAQACEAKGYKLDLVAVNHWDVAIATHSANHPEAAHFCASLDHLRPSDAVPGGKLDLLLASPECTHHSVARGGKPINDQSRASAWHVVRWAEELRPRAIVVENVPEFESWGPLNGHGRPIARLRGKLFLSFIDALRALGYQVDWRVLNSADYGAATSRRRLFIQARLGRRITWPEPTHARTADAGLFSTKKRWRPAREVIDWTVQSQSIFDRKRPLSPNTMARIEAGIRKFWGDAAEPFLVVMREGGSHRCRGVDEPVPTLCASGNHVGLVEPFLVTVNHGDHDGRHANLDDPLPTIATKNGLGMVEPFLLGQQSGHMGVPVSGPVPTVATAGAIALVEPFVISAGGPAVDARPTSEPMPTVLTRDRLAVVQPFLVQAGGPEGTGRTPRSVDDPLATVMTENHTGLVEPFLTKYYGSGDGAAPVSEPVPTVTTKDRFALVERVGLDIRFRMLQPHELAAAMGFPPDYQFAGGRADQVKQVGNAVEVNQARALLQEVLG